LAQFLSSLTALSAYTTASLQAEYTSKLSAIRTRMQGISESVPVFGRSASMHHGLCVCVEWTREREEGREWVR
jgi:hypothetical protein